MEQGSTPRNRSFISELVPGWQPNRAQVLWAIRIFIVLSVLLSVLALIGHQYRVSLLDLVQLLLTASIPVVITVVGTWYTRQRAQDEALEAYLDDMSGLIIDHHLRGEPDSEANQTDSKAEQKAYRVGDVRTVARARTLAVLPILDGHRKYRVLLFLGESNLIDIDEEHHIVWLVGADLSKLAAKSRTNLGWNLSKIHLHGTDLSEADLHGVMLREAALTNTDLSGADLSNTDLSGADLNNADLTRTNLTGARGVTKEQLAKCLTLAGATMPNGHKYEDWLKTLEGQEWLKDKERRKEEGENGSPS